jgi:hypothetical protein
MTALILTMIMTFNASIPAFQHINDKMYVGIENQITISLNGCDVEGIELKVSEGILQKRSDSTYAFVLHQPSQEVKFKLYHKKILCAVKTIQILNIPELEIAFEKENNGFINSTNLQDPGKLIIQYDQNFPEENRSQIVSFQIIIIEKSGVPLYSGPVRGNSLDNYAKDQLKRAKPDDSIQINNIITQNNRYGMVRSNLTKQIKIIP